MLAVRSNNEAPNCTTLQHYLQHGRRNTTTCNNNGEEEEEEEEEEIWNNNQDVYYENNETADEKTAASKESMQLQQHRSVFFRYMDGRVRTTYSFTHIVYRLID
jgi:hypothetical protein